MGAFGSLSFKKRVKKKSSFEENTRRRLAQMGSSMSGARIEEVETEVTQTPANINRIVLDLLFNDRDTKNRVFKSRNKIAQQFGDAIFRWGFVNSEVRSAFIYHNAGIFLTSAIVRARMRQLADGNGSEKKLGTTVPMLAFVVDAMLKRMLTFNNCSELLKIREFEHGMPSHGIPSFGWHFSEHQIREAINILIETRFMYRLKHEDTKQGNILIWNMSKVIRCTLEAMNQELAEYENKLGYLKDEASFLKKAKLQLSHVWQWLRDHFYAEDLEGEVERIMQDDRIPTTIPRERTTRSFLLDDWLPFWIDAHDDVYKRHTSLGGAEPVLFSDYLKSKRINLEKRMARMEEVAKDREKQENELWKRIDSPFGDES